MGAMTRQNVSIDVTPVFGDGTVCEIDPGDGPSHSSVKGGVIKLHGNPAYQLVFQLKPRDPADLQFDTGDPIWSSQDGCPTGYCKDSQLSVVDCTSTTLTVNVDPDPHRNAVHVSLNWSNDQRFDPIIING